MLHIVKLLKTKFLYEGSITILIPLLATTFAFCAEKKTQVEPSNPIISPDTIFNQMSLDEKILQLYIFDTNNQEPKFGKNKPQGLIYNSNNLHSIKQLVNSITDTTIVKPIVITDISKPFADIPIYLNNYAIATTRDTMLFRIWAEQLSDSLAKAGVTVVRSLYTNFNDITAKTTNKELFKRTAQARTLINALWQNGITALIDLDLKKIADTKRREFIKQTIDSLNTLGKRLNKVFETQYTDNVLNYSYLNNKTDLAKLLNSDIELLIGNIDCNDFLKQVHAIIKKNKKLRQKIEVKAYKIIKLKYWIAENHEKPTTRDFQRRLVVWKTLAHSNTCIYNKFNFLPIKDINNLKIIQIGGTYLKGFVSEKYNFCNTPMQYVANKYENVAKALKNTNNQNIVVLINDKISDIKIITLINNTTRNNHSCVVNFGNIENLEKIKSSSLLQVYGNGYASGVTAAQAIFGSIEVNGKTPFNITHDIKEGMGKKIEVCRLQTIPLKLAGFNRNYCDTIDSIVNLAIKKNCFPGCQIFAAYKGKIILNKGYGHYTYDTTSQIVTPNTMYDIASLTKISAATILMMHLSSKNMLDLDKNIGQYFRDTTIDWSNLPADTIINKQHLTMAQYNRMENRPPNNAIKIINDTVYYNDTILLRDTPEHTIFGVPVRLLLEHKSGIYPYLPFTKILYYRSTKRRMLKDEGKKTELLSPEELKKQAYDEFFSEEYQEGVAENKICYNLWLKNKWRDSVLINTRRLHVDTKQEYKYSDVNMIILQQMAEDMLESNADDFLQNNFYQPLGMYHTHYNPTRYYSKSQIAPTAPNLWTGEILQGDVHDPSAEILGGVSGNAGIFSTAKDLGVLFQMVLNQGNYGGNQYLTPEAIKQYTTKQAHTGRALGFDMYPSAYCADSASVKTFGHTGFTGTCAWVDPDNEIVIVFLSNRVYPDEKNQNLNKYRIRKLVNQAIYNGIANAEK